MVNPRKLTATNWSTLECMEKRVGEVYTGNAAKGKAPSPLNVAQTIRLLHDVRAYKTLLKQMKQNQTRDSND